MNKILRVIASASNDDYLVEIIEIPLSRAKKYVPANNEYIPGINLVTKKATKEVVLGGVWCNFWDSDLQEVLGVDKKDYDSMTFSERAECDAKVQLIKYYSKNPNAFIERGFSKEWLEFLIDGCIWERR